MKSAGLAATSETCYVHDGLPVVQNLDWRRGLAGNLVRHLRVDLLRLRVVQGRGRVPEEHLGIAEVGRQHAGVEGAAEGSGRPYARAIDGKDLARRERARQQAGGIGKSRIDATRGRHGNLGG